MDGLSDAEFKKLTDMGEAHVQGVHQDLHQIVGGNQHLAANAAQQTWNSGQCRLTWGGFVFTAFSADIPFFNNTLILPFRGRAGGLVGGFGMVWGGMVASVDPKTLPGRTLDIQFNIAAAYLNINFWDQNTHQFLGSYIGAGTSFGAGIGGGTGSF